MHAYCSPVPVRSTHRFVVGRGSFNAAPRTEADLSSCADRCGMGWWCTSLRWSSNVTAKYLKAIEDWHGDEHTGVHILVEQ
jgi:hypothetical protein